MVSSHLSIDEVILSKARKKADTNSLVPHPPVSPLRISQHLQPRLHLSHPETTYVASLIPPNISIPDEPSIVSLQDSPAAVTDTLPPSSSPFADLHSPHPLPVLIRATDGKSKDERKNRVKISTIVQADDLEKFFVRYAEICKVGMGGLKKRDRSGRKAKAKKKKGIGAEGEKKG